MADRDSSRARRDVVVVGASAGGPKALRAMAASLPPDLPATVVVVLHVPAYGRSVLPDILSRSGPLPARHVMAPTRLAPGEILVAPPDRHLVISDGQVVPTSGPTENGHRPAIDVLFRSAARALSRRVVGVELFGVLDDGAAGMWAIRAPGGMVVVQDPSDCLYPEMPRSVIEAVGAHHVVRASALGALLDGVTRQEVSAESVPPPSHLMVVETDMAQMEEHVMDVADRPGEPAGFSCPDCGGTLFEVREGTMTRYRCRVGHAWTTKGLIGEQAVQVDNALWIALRALEEKAALADQLADRAVESGSVLTAGRFREQAEDSREAARQVRRLIEARPAPEMELVDE